ncbi:MAG: TrkH family potassium uptake protein [Gemmatimonadetes bacterium]|nr:TrkH family potassium uptake protein [Gemmatimonadota bacterium]
MSLWKVLNVVGLLQVFLALSMALTGVVALGYGDGDALGFFLAALVTFTAGGAVYARTRFEEDVTAREGYAIVTFAWAATAIFGSLPFLFTGVLASPMAAFFEAMSGFTTTGATVFGDIEGLPHGILLWRSMTHWIGGMGIIVLVIAVLPYLGVGGMQLFRAEVPGPTPERLRPRIAQTAKLLWFVYFGLTAVLAGLYLIGGMGPFDAVNHSFSTLATGGFSTKNASMAAMSPFIQWVTIVFMYLAGVNYALHFRAATGRFQYFKDQEWRFFTLVLLGAAAVIIALNLWAGTHGDVESAIRDGLFQVLAITTTTGYVSADYELWVPGARMVLFALFFVGGMAGSTSGGIKALRVMLLLKQTRNELRKHLHPRAVFVTRIGAKPVKDEVGARVVGFVMLYLLLCLAGALALALTGIEPLTAIGGSIASVGNVGPSFADLGPTDNYGWMSSPGLGVLTFLMLVGRLEIYTVVLLFHPEMWRDRSAYH